MDQIVVGIETGFEIAIDRGRFEYEGDDTEVSLY